VQADADFAARRRAGVGEIDHGKTAEAAGRAEGNGFHAGAPVVMLK